MPFESGVISSGSIMLVKVGRIIVNIRMMTARARMSRMIG